LIFDCPKCSAENGVPASTIEPDGRLLKCRRCLQIFRVFPPEGDDLSNHDWMGDGQVPGSTDPASMIWTTEGPKTRIDPIPEDEKFESNASALGSNEQEQEQEQAQTDTDEVNLNALLAAESDSKLRPPSVRRAARLQSENEPPDNGLNSEDFLRVHRLEADSQVIEPYGVHEDPSEAALPGLSLSISSSSELAIAGQANDSEASIETPSQEPPARLNRVLSARDLWRTAPLALKAAVAVFPIAFIGGLILGGPSDMTPAADATPVQLATNSESDRTSPVVIPAVVDVPQNPQMPPPGPGAELRPTAGKSEGTLDSNVEHRLPSDHLAPSKHAFVIGSRLRVRTRPSRTARLAGTIRSGALVRVYDKYETWSLIFVPSGGPVGFVKTKYLADRRPVSVLAREMGFNNCSARRAGSIGGCMESARAQERECLTPCGPADSLSETGQRCHQICAQAFDLCANSCRVKTKSKKRRRRRRRR
jgi:predicted Zn finger-like uncharacterized protein